MQYQPLKRAKLTFACELTVDAIVELFTSQHIYDQLIELGATVSMGMLDFSPERACLVRDLNRANIPVVAWLLLPKEQGYWLNVANSTAAAIRYQEFKMWTDEHKLLWQGVGLDIEPDMSEFDNLLRNRWAYLPQMLDRMFTNAHLRLVEDEYAALVQRIRNDGYLVTTYQFPLIIDERAVGSTLLRRILGLVDIRADREMLMLYSSFFRKFGIRTLWSYAPQAQILGIGSSGGGVDIGELTHVPPLEWHEFSRDLRLAQRWTNDIFIFSLEGCVDRGWLTRLTEQEWDEAVTRATGNLGHMTLARRILARILWLSSHMHFAEHWLINGLRLVARVLG